MASHNPYYKVIGAIIAGFILSGNSGTPILPGMIGGGMVGAIIGGAVITSPASSSASSFRVL